MVPLGIMLFNVEVKATASKLFPFEVTPDGFQVYLNNLKNYWVGVDSIVFENPKQCEFSDAAPHLTYFQCKFDYAKYSALGQQTCISNTVWYIVPKGQAPFQAHPSITNEGECGPWQKVEELPSAGLSEKEIKERDEYEQKNANPNKSSVPGTSNLSNFAALLIASLSGAAIFAVVQKMSNKSNKDKT